RINGFNPVSSVELPIVSTEPPETPAMLSPFPGMDPYLEQFWGDIHHRLITYACDALQRQLPGGLLARVDERVFVEPADGQGRNIVTDVRVVERGRPQERGVETGTGSRWPSRW